MPFLANSDAVCRCGSGRAYVDCCKPYHLGRAFPDTAEQLMRSRYAAYALQLEDYLLATWAESSRPNEIKFENGLSWQQLEILNTRKGRIKDKRGWVAFKATYQLGLTREVLSENSEFERDRQGRWVYLKGEFE